MFAREFGANLGWPKDPDSGTTSRVTEDIEKGAILGRRGPAAAVLRLDGRDAGGRGHRHR